MPQLYKKSNRLIELAKKGGNNATLLLLDYLHELEDKILSLEEQLSSQPEKEIPEDAKIEKISMRLAVKLATLEKGDKGDSVSDEHLTELITLLIPDTLKGIDGQDYVLTEQDKKEIAQKINVPIVEKVIEKTEVIKEQPIITNEIKEIAKYETPGQIRNKLEELKGDERLDKSAIKGLEEEIEKLRQMRGLRTGTLGGVLNVGVRVETPVGTIDGINTIFTAYKFPKYVVGDGITYFENQGYAYSGKTLTMTIPPSNYLRSFY